MPSAPNGSSVDKRDIETSTRTSAASSAMSKASASTLSGCCREAPTLLRASASGRQRPFESLRTCPSTEFSSRQVLLVFERPLPGIHPFGRVSIYVRCTLGPVIGAANFAVLERPDLAGSASTPRHPGVAVRNVASSVDCFRWTSAAPFDPYAHVATMGSRRLDEPFFPTKNDARLLQLLRIVFGLAPCLADVLLAAKDRGAYR